MSQPEQWQLSGTGAESYERFQVPSMFEPLARLFLKKIALRPGDRVLDVACGTGIVARLVAASVAPAGEVVGVDLNAGMLSVAGSIPLAGDSRMTWRQSDAAALPFENAAFDTVLCQQGLQFFPDKETALGEMHRVLKPGGMLGLCVWRSIEHSPCNSAVVAALTPHVGEGTAGRLRAPFALGDAGRLRDLIRGAGFREIDMSTARVKRRMAPPSVSVPGHIASTPIAATFAALPDTTRSRLIAEIGDALHRFHDANGMAVPQETHIVVARK